MIIVTIQDVLDAGYCGPGAEVLARRYKFDYMDFSINGIAIERIEGIDNALVQNLCKVARERHAKQQEVKNG